MHRSPRQLSSSEELHAAALRALMRRAHSVSEMRHALERRCGDESLVATELDALMRQNLLDDARYARDFTRNRAAVRRQGRFRITQELRRRGIADRHIESALDEVFAAQDEAALVRQRLERKLRGVHGPLDKRRLASLYGSLLRAGFSADLVRAALHSIGRSGKLDPDDPLAPDAEP